MTPYKTNRQINLESLDDRIVPAGMIDLTTDNAVGMTAGGVLTQVDARPTGTGYIHSFVRLQANGSGSTAEQGYNTNARPLQYDENNSPVFTRALTFGKVPFKTIEGQSGYFREFLLDINQKSSAPYLSLDDVKVFVANRPDLNNYNPATGSLSGPNGAVATKVWEFGAGDWAKLNYRLNSGSGAGDMTLAVPESAFTAAGATLDSYVYVYSKFGGNGFQANSGFEEWAVSTSGTFGFPDNPGGGGGGQAGTGTSSLSGFVYLDGNDNGVKDPNEFGIQGVTVHISGWTDSGQSYERYLTTEADGSYKFSNLESGTYMIWEEQPEGYMQGMNSVGQIAGVDMGSLSDDLDRYDYILNIHLGNNEHGVNYNFGELLNNGQT